MPVRLRSSGRTPGIAAILALLLLVLISSPVLGQQAQVGIYSDVTRSSCSLSDASGGQIRAYVIVNSTSGITGVRFSAPKPACFNATWVGDEVPNGYVTIGDSQTDISIATGGCQPGLQHVLTMVFQKTSTTTPCCQFSILPAQEQTDVVYTDCSFTQYTLATTNAYINADATCPCSNGLNNPPSAPFNPYPNQNYINIPSELTLTWQATDPELDPLTYDVYLGTQSNPPQVATNLTQASFHVDSLAYQTKHYWKVVVKDNAGNSTVGPVWAFTVGQENGSPGTPNDPRPRNDAIDEFRTLTLNWGLIGGTGPVLNFEVHFGTTATPPVVATIPGSAGGSYGVQNLALDTTYYWYVISLGENGKKSTGPVWRFHTVLTNPPPNAPVSPTPANQAAAVPTSGTLQWVGSDPEGQPLEYDVYFGTDASPPLAAHRTTASYDVSNLVDNTTYHWRVVAFDNEGASTSGPVWSFRTMGVGPPTVPQLVTPALDSTVSPNNTQLAWTSTDPEGGHLVYDIYLGKTLPLPIIYSSLGASAIGVNLQQSTTYFWKIVARDPDGLTTEGPVWSFNTKAIFPPNAPNSPSPSNAATGVSRNPTLTWQCTDPDNQALHYTVWFGAATGVMNPYYNVNVKSFTPNETLAAGHTYFWEVWAYDTDGSESKGQTWYFTTISNTGPPSTPVNVAPPDHATDQPLTLDLKWSSTDPDGFPLTYSVYLGPIGALQKVASNVAQGLYTATDLMNDTAYSWRIVARDVDGYTTTGPIWYFTTSQGNAPRLALGLYSDASGTSCSLADKGAGLRNVYVVLNGPTEYTGVRFAATKPPCFNATWMSDNTPYAALGNSQTDVSIGFGGCVTPPVLAMTITYLSAGNTQGCCNYSVAPPLLVGQIQATDCNFTLLVPHGEPVLGISSTDACPACESKGYLAFAESADTCLVSGAHPFTADLKLNTVQDISDGSIDVVIDPSLTFVSCQRGTMIEDWPTFTYQLQDGVLHLSAAGTMNRPGIVGGSIP